MDYTYKRCQACGGGELTVSTYDHWDYSCFDCGWNRETVVRKKILAILSRQSLEKRVAFLERELVGSLNLTGMACFWRRMQERWPELDEFRGIELKHKYNISEGL